MKRVVFGLFTWLMCAAYVFAADYRESTVSGEMTTWRRAANVTISNPYNGVPVLIFYEEDKIRLPNGSIMSGPGVRDPQIKVNFDTPLAEFPLRHPVTGEVIGTAKHQDLYVLLYSLYLDLAAKRDASLYVAPFIDDDAGTQGTNP